MKTQVEPRLLSLSEGHCIRRGYKKSALVLLALIAVCPQHLSAATYQMTTPANDDGQGNFVFLDRHYVDCSVNAINSLQLFRPSATEIAYSYGCTDIGSSTGSDLFTPGNDDGGGNVVYLDRHTINCEGKGLQFLHLERPTANTVRYQYRCGGQMLSNLTDYFTATNDDGGGNAVFLDRHTVSCPNNEVLS